MPAADPVKVSFADIFKSSKTIREEMAAATYKREALAARSRRASAALAAQNGKSAGAGGVVNKGDNKQSGPQMIPVSPVVQNGNGGTLFTYHPQQRYAQDWAPEKFVRLVQLKEANAPWPYISIALNAPVDEVKRRWKMLRPDEAAKEGKKKEAKEDKKVAFSEPIVQNGKDGKKQKKKDQKTKPLLYVDENLTLEEVLLLNRLATRYDQEKWLRISSRFYDKTGKRLSPEEAKKHVEQEQKIEE